MHIKGRLISGCISMMMAALIMQPASVLAKDKHDNPIVVIAPKSGDEVERYTRRIEESSEQMRWNWGSILGRSTRP
jgi:hypothetical protein